MFEPRFPLSGSLAPVAAFVGNDDPDSAVCFTIWSPIGASTDTPVESAPDTSLDAYAEGFAAGHAAALAEARDTAAADEATLSAMADAIRTMANIHNAAVEQSLALALQHLLASVVGIIDIPAATLRERAADLLSAVAATAAPTALYCHPDDAARIGDDIATLPVRPDPAMVRGSLRLATSTGWIDDSIADRLAQIGTMLIASSAS